MSDKNEDRREQIFSIAAKLFSEKGYERTSLQEVADAMGFTKAAFYYYYNSKEQLLFEIMKFVIDKALADIREVSVSDLPPEEKLREFVRCHMRFFATRPAELTIMATAVDSLGEEHREVIIRDQRDYVALVKGIVAGLIRGRRDRGFDDETCVAFALLGSLNWLYKWYDPQGRITPERLAEHFLKLFCSGLGCDDGRESSSDQPTAQGLRKQLFWADKAPSEGSSG